MDEARWESVDRYLVDALVGPDPVLDAALEEARWAGLPQISVSPAQGKLLFLLARIAGARRILEIGTLAGYSTIWLARALPPEGRLVSAELETRHAEIARANLARAGLASKVDVRVGPALETLAALERDEEGPFDLVFIDADKTTYPDYLAASLRLCAPGSVIVADNVVRDGEVANPASTDPNVKGVREMVEVMGRTSALSATVIQTVGEKGYDGFALAVVVS